MKFSGLAYSFFFYRSVWAEPHGPYSKGRSRSGFTYLPTSSCRCMYGGHFGSGSIRLTGRSQSVSALSSHFNGVSHVSLTALVPEIWLPVTCTSSRRKIRDHVSNVYVQPVEIKFLYGAQSLTRGVEYRCYVRPHPAQTRANSKEAEVENLLLLLLPASVSNHKKGHWNFEHFSNCHWYMTRFIVYY